VFDREENLIQPLLRIERRFLRRDFDRLRALLGPWQIWFFQKRRVVRLLDKVFDHEFNLERAEEFRLLVDRRLGEKRMKMLDNFRSTIDYHAEQGDHKQYLSTASTAELVDVHFFLSYSQDLLDAMNDALLERCEPSSFEVLFKIFPDHPRDSSANYYFHPLTFLMSLAEHMEVVNWLPAFLSPGGGPWHNLNKAVEKLIPLCLSFFEADEGRKAILLFS
jgi:hypothetical protein